jgi:hypothetical protein
VEFRSLEQNAFVQNSVTEAVTSLVDARYVAKVAPGYAADRLEDAE